MNDCTQLSLDPAKLDPGKRVNYTLGMVLGEDDLRQEQAYFLEKHRLHHRTLHGYGTLCGLRVTAEGKGRIRVSRGLAVTPQGREVRVCADQCGDLDVWLNRNTKEVAAQAGAPPGPLSVFVILCPRECETDTVPIAGGPCRTDEESMAASRITESFEVRLSFTPPAQIEEDMVRQFGDILRGLEVSATPGAVLSPAAMADLVRSLIPVSASPPSSPPPASLAPGSPPMAPSWPVHPDDLAEVLRAAFRTWTTEVRPALLSERDHCSCGQPDEACILLARLEVNVSQTAGQWAVAGYPTIDETDRPVLLSTRVLQEALLCGSRLDAAWVRTFATLFLLRPDIVRAWVHHPDLVTLPAGAVEVEVNGASTGSPVTVATLAVSPVLPGHNVFDLQLSTPLVNGSRLTVRFDAALVEVGSSPTRSLAVELDTLDYGYLDRIGQTLEAHLGVCLPALDDLSDVSVCGSPVNDGDVLTRRGDQWVAETPAPPVTPVSDHGALSGLEDDDHRQYLLVTPAAIPANRALTADLPAAGHKITGLAQAAFAGEAVPYEQAIKDGQDARGDLFDTYPNPKVVRLSGRAVRDAAPATGQVLQWTGSDWAPATLPAAGGISITDVAEQLPTLPFATITPAAQDRSGLPRLRVWFHLKAARDHAEANLLGVMTFTRNHVQVFAENDSSAPFLNEIVVASVSRESRNVYLLTLRDPAQFAAGHRLRLVFALDQIIAADSRDPSTTFKLREIVTKIPLKWLGHDGENSVTVFFTKQPFTALGIFDTKGNVTAATNGLSALDRARDQRTGEFRLFFPDYDPARHYAVTATQIIIDPGERVLPFAVGFPQAAKYFQLLWGTGDSAPLGGFMVHIAEIL